MRVIKDAFVGVLVLLVVIGLSIGGWYGYWHLAKTSQTNRYKVNTQSQQYQGGLVSQERDRVQAYDQLNNAVAVSSDASVKNADVSQIEQIKETFCQVYLDLSVAPVDLMQAHARICA